MPSLVLTPAASEQELSPGSLGRGAAYLCLVADRRSLDDMKSLVRQISLLLLTLRCVTATWKQEHAVKGLPTVDGSELTSYAGRVPVRKDEKQNIEVPHNNVSIDMLEWSILLAF